MAFPSVVQTSTSRGDASNATGHSVTLPGGLTTDNLLIIAFANDGSATVTNSDFTKFFDAAVSGAIRLTVWYRKVDGTEGGTTTFTTSAAERSAHAVYEISGAEDPATQAPEDSTGATGTSTTPDPDAVTPTGGAKDYMFIGIEGHDRDRTTDVFPTNCPDSRIAISGNGANSAGVGVASEQSNASSFEADTFTISASDQWVAVTVAIHPATAVAPTGTGAPEFEDFILTSSGVMQPSGTGIPELAPFAVACIGEQPHEAVGAPAIEVEELVATGVQTFIGTGAPEIEIEELAAAGVQKFVATGVPTIEIMELTTVGEQPHEGVGALDLEIMELVAVGVQKFISTGMPVLEIMELATIGQVGEPPAGTGAPTLEIMELASAAVMQPAGAGAPALEAVVLVAVGTAGNGVLIGSFLPVFRRRKR